MNSEVRIDVCDGFNLIDVMKKCPYSDEKDAINDLKKCLVYCQSVPPVYMIKMYDAINEYAKVSYTNESVAMQILKKIVIFPKTVDRKKNYTAWTNAIAFALRAALHSVL